MAPSIFARPRKPRKDQDAKPYLHEAKTEN